MYRDFHFTKLATMLLMSVFILWVVLALLSSPRGKLSCGVFGYVGRERPNIHAINLLGTWNQSRGKHSCGIYINGEIFHGTGTNALWENFAANTQLPRIKENRVVIGHARHATVGSTTQDNAHPFWIDLVDEQGASYTMVGAHNGTINNIDELCEKYNLVTEAGLTDSVRLLMLIDREGYTILDEYIGYATLTYSYVDEPNVLYMYHGASKETTHGVLKEERPLVLLMEPEGMYYSSMIEPLRLIKKVKDAKPLPYTLEYNVLYRIDWTEKEAKFKKLHVADRETNNIPVSRVYGGGTQPIPFPHPAPTVTTTVTGSGNTFSPNPVVGTIKEFQWLGSLLFDWQACTYSTTITGTLMNGIYFVNDKGEVYTQPDTTTGPGTWSYFHKGYLIKDHEAYQTLTHRTVMLRLGEVSDVMRAKGYSSFTMYPVPYRPKGSDLYWFFNGSVQTYMDYTPIWTRLHIINKVNSSSVTADEELNIGPKALRVFLTDDEALEAELDEQREVITPNTPPTRQESNELLATLFDKSAIEDAEDVPDEDIIDASFTVVTELPKANKFWDIVFATPGSMFARLNEQRLLAMCYGHMGSQQLLRGDEIEFDSVDVLLEVLSDAEHAVNKQITMRRQFEDTGMTMEELTTMSFNILKGDTAPTPDMEEVATTIIHEWEAIQDLGTDYVSMRLGTYKEDEDMLMEEKIEEIAVELQSLHYMVQALDEDGDSLELASSLKVLIAAPLSSLISLIRTKLESDPDYIDLLTVFIENLKTKTTHESSPTTY